MVTLPTSVIFFVMSKHGGAVTGIAATKQVQADGPVALKAKAKNAATPRNANATR